VRSGKKRPDRTKTTTKTPPLDKAVPHQSMTWPKIGSVISRRQVPVGSAASWRAVWAVIGP
jgi:hypothetical protein